MDDPDDFAQQSSDAADRTAQAFEAAGERISAALERAARSGELSFNRLAESIVQDLVRTAITDLIFDPLSRAIGSIGGGGAGGTGGQGAAPLNLTLNVTGVSDLAGFERSQTQIAAGLARAVRSGGRYG